MKKALLSLLVFSIGLLILTGCTASVNCKDVIFLDYKGLSGNASASYSIICDDAFKEFLYQEAKIKISPNKNLKNGDEVTVSVSYDEARAKAYKVKPVNTEFKVKVSGLDEGTEVDLFEGLVIEYTGKSGQGQIKFDESNCLLEGNGIDFTVNSPSGFSIFVQDLKNGDEITVYASIAKNTADDNHYIITNTVETEDYQDKYCYYSVKKYTVSGLEE